MTTLKIVYVLSTDQIDYLYLLAASALLTRMAVPACTMVCVTNHRTHEFATASGVRLKDGVEDVAVVESPHPSPLVTSRFLKTTLRSHVVGDFLYLDLDAVIISQDFRALLDDTSCVAASQNRDHLYRTGMFPEDIGKTIYTPLGWDHPFLPYLYFCLLRKTQTGQPARPGAKWNSAPGPSAPGGTAMGAEREAGISSGSPQNPACSQTGFMVPRLSFVAG